MIGRNGIWCFTHVQAAVELLGAARVDELTAWIEDGAPQPLAAYCQDIVRVAVAIKERTTASGAAP